MAIKNNKNFNNRKINKRRVRPIYRQDRDRTIRPFLARGERYLGQKGAEKQQRGLRPTALEIRVKARKLKKSQLYGAGLDEGLPTDQRNIIADLKNKTLAGIQSGLRGSTDKTILVTSQGQVAGHTGAFRSLTNANSSTHTQGQADAHDTRRSIIINANVTDDMLISNTTQAYVQSLAHGTQILNASHLAGAIPNDTTYGIIEQGLGPHRIKLAQDSHENRETLKRRLSRFERETKLPRSSSQERTPIDNNGNGGQYLTAQDRPRRNSVVRSIISTDKFEYAADHTAYFSEPFRHNPD